MLDFIVIGSGVSGGRIAYHLTQAGAKCLLLEAGRAFDASNFPSNELDASTQLFWNGGLEVSEDGHLGFLRAKCVGGTSIVNQALLNRFDDLAWNDWKDRSGVRFFNSTEMNAYYDKIESQTTVSPIPEKHFNQNTKLFIKAFDQLGYGWEPLHRSQKDCKLEHGTDCMVCLGGCPRNSKQSALVTSIKKAKELGLEIQSQFEVAQIESSNNEVKVHGIHEGTKKTLTAKKVILASGSLGNTSILFKSGFAKKLPALGHHFCCHPQFMTYALYNEPINAHKGAFQGVEGEDKRFRELGLKFENVFAPPIATAMLMPGYGKNHAKLMKRYRYYASMEVAIRDTPEGKIVLNNKGKLILKKTMSSEDQTKSKLGLQMVSDFFKTTGAKEIISCDQKFGLHLMGGCSIGTDERSSVVNPEFQVHGLKNVYAADSSIFPTAPGINPSFTIMALSQKAAEGLIP